MKTLGSHGGTGRWYRRSNAAWPIPIQVIDCWLPHARSSRAPVSGSLVSLIRHSDSAPSGVLYDVADCSLSAERPVSPDPARAALAAARRQRELAIRKRRQLGSLVLLGACSCVSEG